MCLSGAAIFEKDPAGTPLAEFEVTVRIALLKLFIGAAVLIAAVSICPASSFPSSGPTTPGNAALLRDGVASAPANAPVSVKRAIWAANQLRTKPYRYGGGHKRFDDNAYDCSGTVSYALAGAGLVTVPMSSKEFRDYGSRGPGKWITVYARNGHTFATIAGLRLDTTPFDTMKRDNHWAPRWQLTPRAPRGFEARHPAGL
jgi:hypothetical protein